MPLHLSAHRSSHGKLAQYVTTAARDAGFDERDTTSLALAAEEILSYLAEEAAPGAPLRISCTDARYCLRLAFSFACSAPAIHLRAFNLTYRTSLHEETGLEELGLLIASRMVDRFAFTRDESRLTGIELVKERSYPRLPDVPLSVDASTGTTPDVPAPTTVRRPTPAEVARLVALAGRRYDSRTLPSFFDTPQKVADMIAGGEFGALAVCRGSACPHGAVLWHGTADRLVECYGPFLVGDAAPGDAALLVDGCLEAIVGERVVGLLNRHPTPDLPRDRFEELGASSLVHDDGSATLQSVFYRPIVEDPGATVTAHPVLEDFLTQEYRRLVLPREIRFRTEPDGPSSPHSVLSAEFHRARAFVLLRPVWPGDDIEANIREHLALLERDRWRNIACAVDLGQAWQVGFAPALVDCGFLPRMLAPHAGAGDLVVFRRPGALDALVPRHIRRFEPYVPSRPIEKPPGATRLLRLNNNENALGPPPAAIEAIRRFSPIDAARYPSGDAYPLRCGLADRHGLHPEQFVVGNGANEIIALLIKAFCQVGDNIVTADKTYGGYEWIARFSGIEARLAPLVAGSFDPAGLLSRADEETKIVFLCNPNNPTGQYWPRETLVRFLDAVHGRWIVVLDEAYCEFVEQADYPNGLALLASHPNLVVFRTFSKMYGLAGLRIGYLAADVDTANIIRRTAIVYSVNSLAQQAALAALGDEEHIARTREMVAAGKRILHPGLESLRLEHGRGVGNFVPIQLPVNDNRIYRRLLERGIVVRTMTPLRFPDAIRVTIAEEEAMRLFLDELAAAIRAER